MLPFFTLGKPTNKACATIDSGSSFASFEAQALGGGYHRGLDRTETRNRGRRRASLESLLLSPPLPPPTPVFELQFFVEGGISLSRPFLPLLLALARFYSRSALGLGVKIPDRG